MKKFGAATRATDYYAEQKGWSSDVMKKAKIPQAPSTIVNIKVANKIKKVMLDVLKDAPEYTKHNQFNTVSDLFEPQFYQLQELSKKLTTSTDYGLVEARFCLENEELIIGAPFDSIEGDTLDTIYLSIKTFYPRSGLIQHK